MKVLYITAECKPFSKVGGVGDVAGELPPAIRKEGIDIEIVTPLYGKIDSKFWSETKQMYNFIFHGQNETVQVCKGQLGDVPVNFLKNETYFENHYSEPYVYSDKIPYFDDVIRFSFFSKACLYLIKQKQPDIVHINDWVLGYLFGQMVIEKQPSKRVLTIHNIGYQGNIGIDVIKDWDIANLLKNSKTGQFFRDPRRTWNSVNPLKLALELCHMANTVSPNYCREITQPEDLNRYFEGGKGLDEVTKRLYEKGKLIGILNGFEYRCEPTDSEFKKILDRKAEIKSVLSKDFANPDAFLLGFVGRAVEQKFKLLTEKIDGKNVLEHILEIPGLNVAILATGLPEYEAFLRELVGRDNCSITIAFDRKKAMQISLGSDVFLMPSLFEPCGITQMESLSNATPPLVRWTGGLVDTVIPFSDANGTGFGFDGSTREEVLRNLIKAVKEAKIFYEQEQDNFRQLQRRGFNQRFLWSETAQEYIEKLYKPALNESYT
jgi:starch synthase